jgi:hypothetical protein
VTTGYNRAQPSLSHTADLFDDESTPPSNIFAAKRVAQTKKSAPASSSPRPSSSRRPKSRQVGDTILYRTQVTITQVGEANLIGEFTLQAGKRLQSYHIVALGSQNEQFCSLLLYFSLSSTFGLFLCSIVAGWPFNARNDPNVDDRESIKITDSVRE